MGLADRGREIEEGSSRKPLVLGIELIHSKKMRQRGLEYVSGFSLLGLSQRGFFLGCPLEDERGCWGFSGTLRERWKESVRGGEWA